MNYYVVLYVYREGAKRIISQVVESEEVAKQFCKDMNEFCDSNGSGHYAYRSREQLIEEMK